MKNLRVGFLFLFLSLYFCPAQAQIACSHLYLPDAYLGRSAIYKELQRLHVPTVIKQTSRGSLPVVLLNSMTARQMHSLLARTMGTVNTYQPNSANDHGALRFQEMLVDKDLPSMRSRGELHRTGIAWADLLSLLDFSRQQVELGGFQQPHVRVETVYALSENEMRTVNLYHRMRRAAIIRVPFVIRGEVSGQGGRNSVDSVHETCYGFCKSNLLPVVLNEMEKEIIRILPMFINLPEVLSNGENREQIIDSLLAKDDVQLWLREVEEMLLNENHNRLEVYLATEVGLPQSLQEFHILSIFDKMEAVNWLVGYHLTKQYWQLMKNLEMSENKDNSDMEHRRASMIFVYDSLVSDDGFLSSDYKRRGAYSQWEH